MGRAHGADLREPTVEDPSITDPQERERLFGQVDHVRKIRTRFRGPVERRRVCGPAYTADESLQERGAVGQCSERGPGIPVSPRGVKSGRELTAVRGPDPLDCVGT